MKLEKFSQKKICVAVSGGADSVVLLHYLISQKNVYGYTLSAVHCEHGIRGEDSLCDQAFVEELCKGWNIPLFLFKEDCKMRAKNEKESLETSARNFRRESFSLLVAEGKADYIATAHHLNDEAETVLMNLARGTSLTGAKGVEEEIGFYIRPLLSWSKKDILAYVAENGLSYRIDETNFQTDATRNKIRLNVLPKLCEALPSAVENIARFAKCAKEDDEYLYSLSESLLREENEGFTVVFCDKRPLFFRASLVALKKLGVDKDYTFKHLESAFDLQSSQRGSFLYLPKNVRAEKTQTGISFYLQKEEKKLPRANELPFSVQGYDGGRYAVNVFREEPKSKKTEKVLRVDEALMPTDAVFRFRREGDEIRKYGGERKSLKKLFNEKKIPVKEREYLPLIASQNTAEVYCVCGVEIADFLKVTENTVNILYIETIKK